MRQFDFLCFLIDKFQNVTASMALLQHILLVQINKNPSIEIASTNYLYLTCQPYSHKLLVIFVFHSISTCFVLCYVSLHII